MNGRVNLWIVCGVLLASSICASTAEAQFMSGGSYGLGFFNYGSPQVYQQRIPYYALYPPVYYSYPVARTYGYSPFAYPPGTVTPNVRPQAQAATYLNPFVQPKAAPVADKSVDKSVDARPAPSGKPMPVRVAKTYINPFVPQIVAANKHAAPRVE